MLIRLSVYSMQGEDTMSKMIKCTRANSDVSIPEYKSIAASGMDLKAWRFSWPHDINEVYDLPDDGLTLYPGRRVLIRTGLYIELPADIEAQIRPRSGLALFNGISIVNSPGTIDEDYRGEIGVILINIGQEPFVVNKGDRIAQMVFTKVEKYDLELVDELSETVRGAGGYGHTGK